MTQIRRVEKPPPALRVLVADDERDAANTLARLLQHEGYEARTAYDGSEALRVAPDFTPDVVILDIRMPGINGYDVARALRARHGAIVLIALTGWKQKTDKIFAEVAGFDHHFGKPCEPQAIIDLLGRLKQRP